MSESNIDRIRRELEAQRRVGDAWKQAWLSDLEEDEDGPPELCEGCSEPARRRDADDVPLCVACFDSLIAEHEEEVAATTCVHCGAGPGDYSDGFNGVSDVGGCPGFHCFDCARTEHRLAYPGPKLVDR